MTRSELAQIKKEFIDGNYHFLQQLYLDHKENCIKILMSRNIVEIEQAEDLFTDALLLLRDKIINGKIEQLSNPKSYLASVCINMAKDDYSKSVRKKKKMEQLRLLYYESDHTIIEANESQMELIAICKSALSLVSEKCQKILIAYYVHNLSMKEIAEELSLASSDVAKTIKSRCYKTWIEHSKRLKQKL